MVIRELKIEFASRFADFCLLAENLSLFFTSFDADTKIFSHNSPMKVVEMQCNNLLKRKFHLDEKSVFDFYQKYFLPFAKFPNLIQQEKKWHHYLAAHTYVSSCYQESKTLKI